MKRFLILSIIGFVVLTACASPTVNPSQSPDSQVSQLKAWSGTGIKTTESFTITKKSWTIAWSHDPQVMGGQTVGLLQIMVYDAKNPNLPITIAANSTEKGSDISYIHQTGTFFLTINAANTKWEVIVSQ